MRDELIQDDINSRQKTLCIDIENIFIRKVNILEIEELNMLIEIQKYDYYILVDQNPLEESKSGSDEDSRVSGIVINKLESN
jgi:hypothetical protein